jgi:hypothetical protein
MSTPAGRYECDQRWKKRSQSHFDRWDNFPSKATFCNVPLWASGAERSSQAQAKNGDWDM